MIVNNIVTKIFGIQWGNVASFCEVIILIPTIIGAIWKYRKFFLSIVKYCTQKLKLLNAKIDKHWERFVGIEELKAKHQLEIEELKTKHIDELAQKDKKIDMLEYNRNLFKALFLFLHEEGLKVACDIVVYAYKINEMEISVREAKDSLNNIFARSVRFSIMRYNQSYYNPLEIFKETITKKEEKNPAGTTTHTIYTLEGDDAIKALHSIFTQYTYDILPTNNG